MAKKPKLMITGSGGFIFGNFIRQIFYSKLPYNISSIDRVRDSHYSYNIYVNSDHSFYIADINDSHILNVILEKERPDIVIHGAAELIDESQMVKRNVFGTQNIIKECLNIGAKLIHISTDRVYGDLKSESNKPYIESDNMNPKGILAESKTTAEIQILNTPNLRYNILRLSDNYGPWQMVNNLIPHTINSIIDNKDIIIHGAGYQTREWTHVFDTCAAILSIIEKGIDGNIYNITSKQEFSNLEVVQIICNTLEKGHELIKHVESKYDLRYSMSNDKIKQLGWIPQFKLRDGIAQTCQWYLNNKHVLKM